MTVYTAAIDVWTSDTLKKQIVYACIKAANYILVTEPSNAQSHAIRVTWAKSVLSDPYEAAMKMSAGVITNSDIQTGVATDAEVQAGVDAMVTIMAGL